MKPIIRVDDVLQSSGFSQNQLTAFRKMTPLDWFKLATKKWQDYPLVLAVVAEGVELNPKWVAYIKEHPKWKIECHGYKHIDYRRVPLLEAVFDFGLAREILEKTFNQEITTYYPYKNLGNEKTSAACGLAGMKQKIETYRPRHWLENPKIDRFYFHYWSEGHLRDMEEVKCRLLPEKP